MAYLGSCTHSADQAVRQPVQHVTWMTRFSCCITASHYIAKFASVSSSMSSRAQRRSMQALCRLQAGLRAGQQIRFSHTCHNCHSLSQEGLRFMICHPHRQPAAACRARAYPPPKRLGLRSKPNFQGPTLRLIRLKSNVSLFCTSREARLGKSSLGKLADASSAIVWVVWGIRAVEADGNIITIRAAACALLWVSCVSQADSMRVAATWYQAKCIVLAVINATAGSWQGQPSHLAGMGDQRAVCMV